MLILAIDTTFSIASAALYDDDCELSSGNVGETGTHTQYLLPEIDRQLRACKKTADDIGMIAVAVGPGSFTGVRVGVSLAKGLAFGKRIPCVAVSSLEALAFGAAPYEGLVCPVMDARRSQYYSALFRLSRKSVMRLCDDRLASVEVICDALAESGEHVLAFGDGAQTFANDPSVSAHDIHVSAAHPEVSARGVAAAALQKYRTEPGACYSASSLAPFYLRDSQAEVSRKAGAVGPCGKSIK